MFLDPPYGGNLLEVLNFLEIASWKLLKKLDLKIT